jgi:hypothetical protein
MGGSWSCESGDQPEETEPEQTATDVEETATATDVECPEAPEDGEDCEEFDGMTCGGCECGGGFGDPTWDCGGGEETDTGGDTAGEADAGGFPF